MPDRVPTAISALAESDLIRAFLPEPMQVYLARKNPALAADELRRRIAECLKGLILLDELPGDILFSDAIDEIWHYLILQTWEYAEFCSKLPSGRFMRHTSAEYEAAAGESLDRDGRKRLARLTAYFSSYVGRFGPMEADRLEYWPALQRFLALSGWDLDAANRHFAQKSVELGLALQQAPFEFAGDQR